MTFKNRIEFHSKYFCILKVVEQRNIIGCYPNELCEMELTLTLKYIYSPECPL